MAEILQFPRQANAQQRIVIIPAANGFDVNVLPTSRSADNLSAFFVQYDQAEAFAYARLEALTIRHTTNRG